MPAAICCWCRGPLEQRSAGGPWWCATEACELRQRTWGLYHQKAGYVFVPAPKQVEFLANPAKNRLFGGAAGPGKSHAARWGLYRKCHTIPGFEALILRRTMPELRKSHLRKLVREKDIFEADWKKTESVLEFPNGSLLEFGHMEDDDAVGKYLSSEYDEICADEGSTFDGEVLLELSTRARTSKPSVQAVGGAKFDVVTNPGGMGWPVLRDFFIDHTPDLERFPALKDKYRPDQWVYIKALLDDNPYRDADYEDTLAVLNGARYEQLRWGAEYVTEGQFFRDWRETADGVPWHVRDQSLETLRECEWFGSMDWGYNAPGVMLWWCALPDGHYWIGKEWKFQGRSAEEVAETVKRETKALGIKRLRYIACDPSMKAKTGHARGESIMETLLRKGLPMRASDNDRNNGWIRCHQLLRAAPDGAPWLSISPDCAYGKRTVPSMVQDKKNPDDLDTNKDDHWVDAWRYGAMSRPSPTRIVRDESYPVNSIGWLRQQHEASQRQGVLA